MKILIKGATLVHHDRTEKKDILVKDSTIAKVSKKISSQEADEVIRASGKFVFAGFIDMHTHLRTPGREDEETLLSGALAAAKGGFTTILCMPNTTPPIDNYEIAFWIRKVSQNIGIVDIYPVGTITKERKGKELAEFGYLKEAGCLAVSDDGDPVASSLLLRRALEYAKMYNLLLISHAEEKSLAAGVMLESDISAKWGMPAIAEVAESVAVAREIELAYFTASRLHLAHISRRRSLRLIECAKKDKIGISCETCPHYFSLSVKDIERNNFHANFKVNPPLGTEDDKQAIRKALKSGVIDCIATDHAPHSFLEKEKSFQEASFGMIGLEFAFSLSYQLVKEKVLSLEVIADRLSYRPAKILGLEERGEIKEGMRADLVIVDLEKEWVVDKESIVSRSKNTPFLGRKLPGVVEYTISGGKIVYKR